MIFVGYKGFYPISRDFQGFQEISKNFDLIWDIWQDLHSDSIWNSFFWKLNLWFLTQMKENFEMLAIILKMWDDAHIKQCVQFEQKKKRKKNAFSAQMGQFWRYQHRRWSVCSTPPPPRYFPSRVRVSNFEHFQYFFFHALPITLKMSTFAKFYWFVWFEFALKFKFRSNKNEKG